MKKTFIYLTLSLFLTMISCKQEIREDDNTLKTSTILNVYPENPRARPTEGFRITYRWENASMDKFDSVVVRFRDKEGNTLLNDNHIPASAGNTFTGLIEYTREIFFSVWIIRNDSSIYSGLPEGDYSIEAGLYDKKRGIMADLERGEGVTSAGDGFYKIGVLTVDKNALIPDPGEKTLDLTGYKLTFNEEFDSLSVSARGPAGPGGTTWIAHTPWGGDFGDATFTDPGPDFPFTVKDGILRIEARKDGDKWKSGLLSTVDINGMGFKQMYGYFECRAKLPEGPGTWPAFWLMGALNRWGGDGPRINPEIDIIEHYGHWPNRFSYVTHLWGFGGIKATHKGERIWVYGIEGNWHNYGMWIDEEKMILYYDGVEMYRTKTPDGVRTPLYPLVNLALGPGRPLDKTPNPCYMYVDYVKIYSKD